LKALNRVELKKILMVIAVRRRKSGAKHKIILFSKTLLPIIF